MTAPDLSHPRLAIFVSHPIQYYAPWFRHLASSMDVQVFYAMTGEPPAAGRSGFGIDFDWDVPLLEGYPHRVLDNVARRPSLNRFGGCDTPEVASVLQEERFDAAVVFGWNRKSSLQAIVAALRRGVPLLVRGDSQLATQRSWARRAAKYLPFRALLPRVSGHLVVGQRNREYLLHYGVPREKLFFVPHSIDVEFFASEASAARRSNAATAIRAALGIPANAFVCGFVGKFIHKKRPLDVVRAVRHLSSPLETHAVFVGDGPLRAELEAAARVRDSRIHVVGFRNQRELPAHYTAFDCLVLPSDAGETWGLVVNEAAACGVPSVVSDLVGCAPDLIDGRRTGYTFRCGDEADLARRLGEMHSLRRNHLEEVREALSQLSSRFSYAAATRGLRTALAAVVQR